MSQKQLTKRELDLDDKYHVPKCYVQFFKPKTETEPDDILILTIKITLTIINSKRKKNKKSIEIKLDKNIFSSGDKKKLQNKLINKFKGTCNYDKEKDILVLSCSKIDELKAYLMKIYKLDEKEIEVQYFSSSVPTNFRISLVANYNENKSNY